MPTLSFDPFFLGQEHDDKLMTAMSFYGDDTMRLAVTMLPSKSTEHPYATRWLAANVELSGHKEAILKSDGEPAVLKMKKQVMEKIAKENGIILVLEEKPIRDAKSNPDAESANNIAAGLLRCHKAQLDEKLQHMVASDHPIVSWLTMYCGVLYNTTHGGSDGLTPFERARGRRMGRPLCMFGERVLYMPVPMGNDKKAKMEPSYVPGIFLGLVERTGEVIIGTADGCAVRCRSYRRVPKEEQWKKYLVLGLKALPWAPSGD